MKKEKENTSSMHFGFQEQIAEVIDFIRYKRYVVGPLHIRHISEISHQVWSGKIEEHVGDIV